MTRREHLALGAAAFQNVRMPRVLQTDRLRLRPFAAPDAASFAPLAGDWHVARMTSDIPHPLPQDIAARWLKPVSGDVRFAIERDGQLIGGIGYYCRLPRIGELGFWIGKPYWGRGIAKEAARAVVTYGFTEGRLAAMSSAHFIDNPASARVIAQLGFKQAGRERLWSPARGVDVEAITYWLDRATAQATLGATLPELPSPTGWRRLTARVWG
jgi:[ribosomal protein S5]-alanine N-acetyltransferase